MLETASCVKWSHEPITLVPCRQRDFQSFAWGHGNKEQSGETREVRWGSHRRVKEGTGVPSRQSRARGVRVGGPEARKRVPRDPTRPAKG